MKLKLNLSNVEHEYKKALTPMGYTLNDEFCGGRLYGQQVLMAVAIAAILWGIIFGTELVNFWIGIGVSLGILMFLAISWGGWAVEKHHFDLRALILGAGSAVVLYGMCFVGYETITKIVPSVVEQVNGLYALGESGSTIALVIFLLLVSSPGEEIFWRGYVQRWMNQKVGRVLGVIAAALLYAAVHIVSGNVILVVVAFVAGLFWGSLYNYERNIAACTISHGVWILMIYVLFPLN